MSCNKQFQLFEFRPNTLKVSQWDLHVALWPRVLKCQSQLLKCTNLNHPRLSSIPCGCIGYPAATDALLEQGTEGVQ